MIIFGLITETSIKALFTAAFVPGFMLASMIIIYILVRTKLNPSLAPLPEDTGEVTEDFDIWGTSRIATIYLWILAALAGVQFLGVATGFMDGGLFSATLLTIFALIFAWMSLGPKGTLFLTFMHTIAAGFTFVLLLRVLFFTFTGQNILEEGEDPIVMGTVAWIPYLAVTLVFLLGMLFYGFGTARIGKAWGMGKGLVPPIIVIGAVLGSIYGGITGITEAAGMGALAVFLLSIIMDRGVDEWKTFAKVNSTKITLIIVATIAASILVPIILGLEDKSVLSSMIVIAVLFYWCVRAPGKADLLWEGLLRTLRSTGTIIWVTIGAAALAGAYTLAGGPVFIANMIVGSDMPTMGVIFVMMIIFLFMGAFMDWVGIVLLIIPVFLPIVRRLPIEEIGYFGQLEPKHVAVWFGVLFCMNMQVSFLSPPFGPAAFYLKSVAPPHISLTDIFRGFLPFICVQLTALSVLLIWPSIVTVLL